MIIWLCACGDHVAHGFQWTLRIQHNNNIRLSSTKQLFYLHGDIISYDRAAESTGPRGSLAVRRLLLGPRVTMQVLPVAVSAADCRRVETVMCGGGGDRVGDVLARPAGESPKTPARAKRRLRPPPVGDDAHRGRRSFPRTSHAARCTHGHPSPPPRNSLPPPIPDAAPPPPPPGSPPTSTHEPVSSK